MKPRAGQVSVNPSGLSVVTGSDVQTALAQLDTATHAATVVVSGTAPTSPTTGQLWYDTSATC